MHGLYENKINLEVLKKYKDKTLVCFGAGTAAEILFNCLSEEITITYCTDNNKDSWGKKIKEIEIINPDRLKEIPNVFVIIISRHTVDIKEQLNGYGFKENVDYIDFYTNNEMFFKLSKAYNLAEQFINFFNGIPKDLCEYNHVNCEPKIGVVLMEEWSVIMMFFSITIYLLLKVYGYNVTLIIDFIGIEYRNDQSDELKKIVDFVLDNLSFKLGKQECVNLLPYTDGKLAGEDKKQIAINIHDTVVSHFAYHKGEKRDESGLKKIYQKLIELHYKSLDKFLKRSSVDVIVVYNGIVDKRWNYTCLGHKYGKRVVTYEDWDWSSDYPVHWNYDLKNVAELLPDVVQHFFIDKGKRVFERTKLNNYGDRQLVPYSEVNNDKYDVLIPLNVMFDSAVLGLDRIFSTPEEWFTETIEFLVSKKNIRIAVKESPMDVPLAGLNFSSYDIYIKKYLEYDNLTYYGRYAPVNIYNLIENSKIILPYSSTIGIEAAMMDKTVIVHTSCFYSDEKFVKKATSKEDYFNKILNSLKSNETIKDKDNAAFLFSLLRINKWRDKHKFISYMSDWLNMDFVDIMKQDYIKIIIDTIAKNKNWYLSMIESEEVNMNI